MKSGTIADGKQDVVLPIKNTLFVTKFTFGTLIEL